MEGKRMFIFFTCHVQNRLHLFISRVPLVTMRSSTTRRASSSSRASNDWFGSLGESESSPAAAESESVAKSTPTRSSTRRPSLDEGRDLFASAEPRRASSKAAPSLFASDKPRRESSKADQGLLVSDEPRRSSARTSRRSERDQHMFMSDEPRRSSSAKPSRSSETAEAAHSKSTFEEPRRLSGRYTRVSQDNSSTPVSSETQQQDVVTDTRSSPQPEGPSLMTRTTDMVQRLTDTLRRGTGASVDTDGAMLDTMRDTVRPAHAYTATYFVAKLFLLACLVGYTAGIDPEVCPCAEDSRKYVILWGGGVVMGLCLVAVALPDIFRENPLLKAVLMALTFVVLYSVVTYFPMLNALDCACANDWRRWVVEGVVYVVLAIFLLTLVGVVRL